MNREWFFLSNYIQPWLNSKFLEANPILCCGKHNLWHFCRFHTNFRVDKNFVRNVLQQIIVFRLITTIMTMTIVIFQRKLCHWILCPHQNQSSFQIDTLREKRLNFELFFIELIFNRIFKRIPNWVFYRIFHKKSCWCHGRSVNINYNTNIFTFFQWSSLHCCVGVVKKVSFFRVPCQSFREESFLIAFTS